MDWQRPHFVDHKVKADPVTYVEGMTMWWECPSCKHISYGNLTGVRVVKCWCGAHYQVISGRLPEGHVAEMQTKYRELGPRKLENMVTHWADKKAKQQRLFTSKYDVFQVVDGKKAGYGGRQNKLCYGFFEGLYTILAAANDAAVNYRDTAGTAFTTTRADVTNPFFTTNVANRQLGTDTSTVTVPEMWKLTTAITSACSQAVGGDNFGPATVQGSSVTVKKNVTITYTYPSGLYGTNPTIGEVGILIRIPVTSTPTFASVLGSRFASADGTFSPFVTNSTLAFVVQDRFQPA